jgi:alkylated DNA repair dioxygenase AlkB
MNGLYIYPNQIQNGQEIIQHIDEMKWFNENSGNRRYQHYGHTFNYISETHNPIPDFLVPLIEHIEDMCNAALMNYDYDIHTPYFNQCTVNELLPGQNIVAHTDNHGYGDLIGTVTLGAGSTTIFRSDTCDEYSFYAQPNSVYYMEGDARWNATHEIPGATEDNDEGTIIPRGRQIIIIFRHVQ